MASDQKRIAKIKLAFQILTLNGVKKRTELHDQVKSNMTTFIMGGVPLYCKNDKLYMESVSDQDALAVELLELWKNGARYPEEALDYDGMYVTLDDIKRGANPSRVMWVVLTHARILDESGKWIADDEITDQMCYGVQYMVHEYFHATAGRVKQMLSVILPEVGKGTNLKTLENNTEALRRITFYEKLKGAEVANIINQMYDEGRGIGNGIKNTLLRIGAYRMEELSDIRDNSIYLIRTHKPQITEEYVSRIIRLSNMDVDGYNRTRAIYNPSIEKSAPSLATAVSTKTTTKSTKSKSKSIEKLEALLEIIVKRGSMPPSEWIPTLKRLKIGSTATRALLYYEIIKRTKNGDYLWGGLDVNSGLITAVNKLKNRLSSAKHHTEASEMVRKKLEVLERLEKETTTAEVVIEPEQVVIEPEPSLTPVTKEHTSDGLVLTDEQRKYFYRTLRAVTLLDIKLELRGDIANMMDTLVDMD